MKNENSKKNGSLPQKTGDEIFERIMPKTGLELPDDDRIYEDFGEEDAGAGRLDRAVVIISVILALCILGIGAAYLWYNSSKAPEPNFVTPEPTVFVPTPEPTVAPEPAAEEETFEEQPVEETDVQDEYSQLREQADLSMMKNIVNIMLIGVDYAEERETWSGKDGLSAAHSDVMIVLAVNFDENRADLISLPRDTYVNYIPGANGIYKLNASLNCGGGLTAADGAGFEKVCETAEVLLGGIPVDYYYAVTMPAVKQLVDLIGGVDYDLEVTFKIQGRSYKEGYQHMDGQAVLDYLRVRKSGTGLAKDEQGDANRVNRQKKMLVAIFEKVKEAGLLSSIPDLLKTFSGQLYTNCDLEQTAALALTALDMPKENIGMYSMSGSMKNIYSWNFTFTNMSNRRKIIKQIYGVDVSDIRDCTKEYASTLYYCTLAEQYLDTCAPLTSWLDARIEEDDELPEYTATPSPEPVATPAATATPEPDEPTKAPATPAPEGTPVQEPTAAPEPTTAPEPDPTPTPGPTATPEPDPTPTPKPTATPEADPTPTPKPTATPEPKPTEAPEPETSGGEQEQAENTAARAALPEAARLSMTKFMPRFAAETRQYGEEARSLYAKYKAAYEALKSLLPRAKKQCSNFLSYKTDSMAGTDGDLSDACDALKSAAEKVADAFGYTRSLSWSIAKIENTNSIKVDFR